MKARKILEHILYFGLLAGGLIFCWSNIVEYLNGNTSYQEKQEHITFNDLPTLVVCIEKKQPNDSAWIEGSFKYGDDLWIEARVRKDNIIVDRVYLEENKLVDISIGLQFSISEMELSFK